MKKVIVLTFVSLDGVMQAPGGPTEDTDGSFQRGGWTVPFFDDFLGKAMEEQMGKPFDLLLGKGRLRYLLPIGPIMRAGRTRSMTQQSTSLRIRCERTRGASRSF